MINNNIYLSVFHFSLFGCLIIDTTYYGRTLNDHDDHGPHTPSLVRTLPRMVCVPRGNVLPAGTVVVIAPVFTCHSSAITVLPYKSTIIPLETHTKVVGVMPERGFIVKNKEAGGIIELNVLVTHGLQVPTLFLTLRRTLCVPTGNVPLGGTTIIASAFLYHSTAVIVPSPGIDPVVLKTTLVDGVMVDAGVIVMTAVGTATAELNVCVVHALQVPALFLTLRRMVCVPAGNVPLGGVDVTGLLFSCHSSTAITPSPGVEFMELKVKLVEVVTPICGVMVIVTTGRVVTASAKFGETLINSNAPTITAIKIRRPIGFFCLMYISIIYFLSFFNIEIATEYL